MIEKSISLIERLLRHENIQAERAIVFGYTQQNFIREGVLSENTDTDNPIIVRTQFFFFLLKDEPFYSLVFHPLQKLDIIEQGNTQEILLFLLSLQATYLQGVKMDPITAAIVAALATGAASGLTEISKTAIVDAYTKLKTMLANKFGNQSEVLDAVKQVEAKPDSAARKSVLQEEVSTAKADKDPELLEAAKALLAQIKAQPGGEQYIQNAVGDYNIQVQGSGNTVNQQKR